VDKLGENRADAPEQHKAPAKGSAWLGLQVFSDGVRLRHGGQQAAHLAAVDAAFLGEEALRERPAWAVGACEIVG
jgi:hypothetical protein